MPNQLIGLAGKCPISPALEGEVKGHNIKGMYLTGKPRPSGRGASLLSGPERRKQWHFFLDKSVFIC
jgi:hypothetical protein